MGHGPPVCGSFHLLLVGLPYRRQSHLTWGEVVLMGGAGLLAYLFPAVLMINMPLLRDYSTPFPVNGVCVEDSEGSDLVKEH